MTENQIASQDPANGLTLAGAFSAVFAKLLQGVDGMLPAVVTAYDRAQNVATVQPIVMLLKTDGTTISRAPIARVPVLALGGGGFVINFPLKQGDLGWIEASDRDISIYMQSLRESQPATVRLHSFEDARFIPDMMRQFDTTAVAADAMTIQSADGAVRVELSPTSLLLKAPSVHIDASDVVVDGTTTFNDHVAMPAGAEIEGIEFGTHKHTGVQPGGGTSGGPTS